MKNKSHIAKNFCNLERFVVFIYLIIFFWINEFIIFNWFLNERKIFGSPNYIGIHLHLLLRKRRVRQAEGFLFLKVFSHLLYSFVFSNEFLVMAPTLLGCSWIPPFRQILWHKFENFGSSLQFWLSKKFFHLLQKLYI